MENYISCGQLIKQIGDELQKRADNELRSQGLTLAQTGVLLGLYYAPEKQLSMKELEKNLYVAQSTVVGIVSRLERKGFVESCGDSSDKRIKRVRITSAGIERFLATEQDMVQTEQYLLSGLTETERESLYLLLKKVRDTIK